MTSIDEAQRTNTTQEQTIPAGPDPVDGYFRVVAFIGAIKGFSFPIHGYAQPTPCGRYAIGPAFDMTSSFTSTPRPMEEMPLALLIDPTSLAAMGGEAPLRLAVGPAGTESPLRVKRAGRKLLFDLGDGAWIDEDDALLGAVVEEPLLIEGARIIALQNLPDDEEAPVATADAPPPAFTSAQPEPTAIVADEGAAPALSDFPSTIITETAPTSHPIADQDHSTWPAPHAVTHALPATLSAAP